MEKREELVNIVISAVPLDYFTELVQLVSRQQAAEEGYQPGLVISTTFYPNANPITDEKPLDIKVEIDQSYQELVDMKYEFVVARLLRSAYQSSVWKHLEMPQLPWLEVLFERAIGIIGQPYAIMDYTIIYCGVF